MHFSHAFWLPCLIAASSQAVTVYQLPFATTSANAASYTGSAAYSPIVLDPPALPDPLPETQLSITIQQNSDAVTGLSIPLNGTFMGFSIETSVVNQIIGINATYIQVPFLNLMANIKQRAGAVHIRIGGNTQEYAVLVDSLADGKMIEKDKADSTNPTETPTLVYTDELFYLMSNVTSLVNAKWYLGIPFNDTSNLRLGIAQYGEAILGSNLLGLQAGNEPDLYADHQHRPSTYSQYDYFGEIGVLIQALQNDASSIPVRNNLIAPSVSGTWTPESIWDTGFLDVYSSSLGYLAVEQYPDNNCYAQYGIGSPKDPQTELEYYLNHTAGQDIVKPFLNSTTIAQQYNKPFLMFETNTASCGGFPGISNSFASTLWVLDYGLQMGYSNFSGALLHVGGQSVYYNPFTPPPTNQSLIHQWTIGPIFYGVLAIAEALGPTGTAQIMDLFPSSNIYTPAYAIYENSQIARIALFNYMTDSSGASDSTFSINVQDNGSGTTPNSVKVKRMSAPSTTERSNITWAGQTFGGQFESDGRLSGSLDVETVSCSSGTCQIRVPAPGFALVFLTDEAVEETTPSTEMTFSTTAVTKTANTATVASSVLATSNGHSGGNRGLGSTSKGSSNDAAPLAISNVLSFFAFASTWALVLLVY